MPPTLTNSDRPSILKHTREAKGLTLDIVHEATKIPMDALKALEEGYSVRVLSPFYYKGFIKIYAEFLGLDVQETLKEYGLDKPAQPEQRPSTIQAGPAPKSKPRVPKQPNVVGEQIQDSLSTLFSVKNFLLMAKVIGFVIVVIVLLKLGGCVVNHWKSMPKSKPVVTMKKVRHPKAVQAVADDTPAETAPALLKASSDNEKVELAVRAVKDSWIQVKADDKVVFQMTMKKGSMDSWNADRRIELSGRNINELDLEVNGKHIGSLGTSERRAKRVVITKEGLTVKK